MSWTEMSQSAARPITIEPFSGQRPSSTPFLENVRNAIRSVNPLSGGVSGCKMNAPAGDPRKLSGARRGGCGKGHFPYRTPTPSANKFYDFRDAGIDAPSGVQLRRAAAV